MLPNSSMPLNLSSNECMEIYSQLDFDEGLYDKAGRPQLRFRGCRSPEKSRTVMMWRVFGDLNVHFSYLSQWEDPSVPEDSWPYTIAPVPGKGNGMIATRDTKMGETILVERPILLIPVRYRDLEEMESDMRILVKYLDPKDQEVVKGLCKSKAFQQRSELFNIISTNVIKCTFPQSAFCKGYSGLFIDGCRANHRYLVTLLKIVCVSRQLCPRKLQPEHDIRIRLQSRDYGISSNKGHQGR